MGEADELCQRAREIDPTAYWGLNYHGIILKKLKRYPEAIDAYQKAVELKPEHYPGWVNLGTIHALRGDVQKAEEFLRKATDLAWTTQEPDAVDAWRNLASVRLHLKQPTALQTIEEAIAWKRDDAASYLMRARMRLEPDGYTDVRQALYDANTADQLSQQPDPRIKRVRALAHLRNGEFQQAIQYARRAIALKDMAAINHLIIAITEAHRGRMVNAREHFDAAVEQWPSDLEAAGTIATAPGGLLWFETAEEFNRLRAEAEQALAALAP